MNNYFFFFFESFVAFFNARPALSASFSFFYYSRHAAVRPFRRPPPHFASFVPTQNFLWVVPPPRTWMRSAFDFIAERNTLYLETPRFFFQLSAYRREEGQGGKGGGKPSWLYVFVPLCSIVSQRFESAIRLHPLCPDPGSFFLAPVKHMFALKNCGITERETKKANKTKSKTKKNQPPTKTKKKSKPKHNTTQQKKQLRPRGHNAGSFRTASFARTDFVTNMFIFLF